MRWINRNIELPDSTSDPEGSQGYVTFSIRPKQNLPVYTMIENDAQIQFDYNEFIITNNTQIYVNTLKENPATPVVHVYPNPSSDFSNVLLIGPDKELIEMSNIEILDINGSRVMKHDAVAAMKKTIDLRTLPKGVYIVKVGSGNSEFSARLVVI